MRPTTRGTRESGQQTGANRAARTARRAPPTPPQKAAHAPLRIFGPAPQCNAPSREPPRHRADEQTPPPPANPRPPSGSSKSALSQRLRGPIITGEGRKWRGCSQTPLRNTTPSRIASSEHSIRSAPESPGDFEAQKRGSLSCAILEVLSIPVDNLRQAASFLSPLTN